jgi:hypothetical protein
LNIALVSKLKIFFNASAEHGIPVTIPGKNYKVFKCDRIIGAKSGKETCYIRVECSANTIHGHPILESDYLWYLK